MIDVFSLPEEQHVRTKQKETQYKTHFLLCVQRNWKQEILSQKYHCGGGSGSATCLITDQAKLFAWRRVQADHFSAIHRSGGAVSLLLLPEGVLERDGVGAFSCAQDCIK